MPACCQSSFTVRSISCACCRNRARGLGRFRYASRSAARSASRSFLLGNGRRRLAARRARQHFATRRRHQHGVLPLRRQAVVLGHDGPAVGQLADRRLAGIDHRLDGEGHARFQRQPGRGLAVMQDLRLLMELAADSMAAELAHHRVAVLLGVLLDGGPDIAKAGAGPHLADADPHALVRDLHQPARLDARLADEEHAARSEEHTSELQSRLHLVCRLLLEKKTRLHSSHGYISYAVFCLKKKNTPIWLRVSIATRAATAYTTTQRTLRSDRNRASADRRRIF